MERAEGFTVQVGAFRVEGNAQKQKKKLIDMGYDAVIVTLKGKKGKFWYLVRMGCFQTPSLAAKFRRTIFKENAVSAIIRPTGKI